MDMGWRIESDLATEWAISSAREWLLTNGAGAFAMGTVSGANTRRYHGHLVAVTGPNLERTVLLSNIEAVVEIAEGPISLSTNRYVGTTFPDGYRRIQHATFGATAEWTYSLGEGAVVKTLALHPEENSCTVRYANRTSRRMLITLRPLVCHKPYHGNFRSLDGYPADLEFDRAETRVRHGNICLSLHHPQAHRIPFAGWYYRFENQLEADRGLDAVDDLYCPAELRYELLPGEEAILVATTEDHHTPHLHEEGVSDSWERATKHYLIRADDRPAIVAGYPWFTDWGRDTMISIPGLCLDFGRVEQAQEILLGYADNIQDGLIPNRFAEGERQPDYNTVDATLWFVHAVSQTLEAHWDTEFALALAGPIHDVLQKHREGARFGIHVDPEDGLLTQGEPGVQLTWMDVKIGDWVVTPRYGKPVEINGLWVNALRQAEHIFTRLGEDATAFAEQAARAEESFARKFWSARHGWYFDTVDPFDAQLRPNQLIAMSLPFGPAGGDHAKRALDAVEKELLTPYGLRTLGREEIHYRGRYEGPMAERDAAYHQGTVWPWLLGPYVGAVLRLTGDLARAERALSHVQEMMDEYGIGGIAEVYDGDDPFRPGGCPFQAWSVAEVSRAIKMIERAKR